MFCNHCGVRNPDGSQFCASCGRAFAASFAGDALSDIQTVLGPMPSSPVTARTLDGAKTEFGLSPGFVLVDRYRVVSLLGIGGMGRVYLCEDQKLGIFVAIKVLRETLSNDPGAVKRLIAEAKHSIRLSHPNVVRVNHFEDGEMVKFLVMEYVEGTTLAHRIADKGKFPEEEVRRIASEICKGLEHAHDKKVIHRDIKPGNILLGDDGSIKIADFGIARECRDSMSRLTSQAGAGTLFYMSPEQLDGETGERSDIYSVGVVLCEMLSGEVPFRSGDIVGQIRNKVPKPIEGISAELSSIVAKCLEKKSENRFSSARELREALDGTAVSPTRRLTDKAAPEMKGTGALPSQPMQGELTSIIEASNKTRRESMERMSKKWDDYLKKD